MYVNELETMQHYTYTQIKVKEQLVVRENMDVNEHETLSNITLRHRLRLPLWYLLTFLNP
jgi:hypothetical protein